VFNATSAYPSSSLVILPLRLSSMARCVFISIFASSHTGIGGDFTIKDRFDTVNEFFGITLWYYEKDVASMKG